MNTKKRFCCFIPKKSLRETETLVVCVLIEIKMIFKAIQSKIHTINKTTSHTIQISEGVPLVFCVDIFSIWKLLFCCFYLHIKMIKLRTRKCHCISEFCVFFFISFSWFCCFKINFVQHLFLNRNKFYVRENICHSFSLSQIQITQKICFVHRKNVQYNFIICCCWHLQLCSFCIESSEWNIKLKHISRVIVRTIIKI